MIFKSPHIAQDMPPLPHGGPILTEIYDYEVKTYLLYDISTTAAIQAKCKKFIPPGTINPHSMSFLIISHSLGSPNANCKLRPAIPKNIFHFFFSMKIQTFSIINTRKYKFLKEKYTVNVKVY